jgi:CHAT domain-containing protein
MTAYYRASQQGQGRSAALRQAQLRMLKRGSATSHGCADVSGKPIDCDKALSASGATMTGCATFLLLESYS